MKRLISILLALLTIISALAGCGEKHTADVTDSQESLSSYGTGNEMCEDDNNFYFMLNNYIFVVDKKSHKCVPLCNKPDCLHDKQNVADNSNKCNAFINSNLDQLAYYDGKLYFQSYRETENSDGNPITYFMISRMNPDGTNREDIYTTTDLYFFNIKVHRGYIYAHIADYKQEDDGTNQSDDYENAEIYRMPVDGGEWEKLDIPYFGDEHRLILDYRLYGDNLYVISNFYDKDNPGAEYNAAISYDLNKGKATEITDNFNPRLSWMFTVMDGKIYYDNDGKIYKADLDGKNAKLAADLNKKVKSYKTFRVYNNDGENVYITARKEESKDTRLVLLQKNGKVRSYKIPTKEIINKSDLISLKSGGAPDGQLFFSDHEDENGEQYEDYYYLDKTKLGQTDCVKHIYTRKFNP